MLTPAFLFQHFYFLFSLDFGGAGLSTLIDMAVTDLFQQDVHFLITSSTAAYDHAHSDAGSFCRSSQLE